MGTPTTGDVANGTLCRFRCIFTNTEAPFDIGPKRKSAQYVLLDEQPIYRGWGSSCSHDANMGKILD